MTDHYDEDAPEPREERTVYWAGRQWCVTSFGLETVIDHDYDVAAAALGHLTDGSDEPMAERLRHIGSSHSWVDVEDLITAFGVALSIHTGKYAALPDGAFLNAAGYVRRVRWMNAWSRENGFRDDDTRDFMKEMKASGAAADARERDLPFTQVPDPHPADRNRANGDA
ncbi:hypothetical protein [Brevundimonas vesicularis]|uniref:Uncharacterized protein n=1 Tax=Brevundimonas vesicularis TaxID=41276 RepID=A0A1Z3U7A2_BREVE|nr:hypothetical protein [Brevundimonas vesicularis]ASE39158.1 hypothetical protein CEP68_06380 [Brevundimonas vesicularis]